MPCDLSGYTDFNKLLDARDSSQVEHGDDPLEAIVQGPGGASRLFVFTGSALVGVDFGGDSGSIRRGVMRVRLDFPLSGTVRFVAAATVAGLTSTGNLQVTTASGVDCVFTAPDKDPFDPAQNVLIVQAALAIQGGNVKMPRVAYQANVLIAE
jgi:hypothetical protein